jgi:hypothetical protein
VLHETQVFHVGPIEELVLIALDHLTIDDFKSITPTKNRLPREICAPCIRKKMEKALRRKIPSSWIYRAIRRLKANGFIASSIDSNAEGVRYKVYVLTDRALFELRTLQRVRKNLSKRTAA